MADKNTLKKYEIIQPLLLAVMVILGILLGKKIEQSALPESKSKTRSAPGVKNYSVLLEEATRFIDARYIDSLNINSISELAIAAMVRELDPFSVYIPAKRPSLDTADSFYKAYGFSALAKGPKWYIDAVNASAETAFIHLDVGDVITEMNAKTPTSSAFNSWSDTTIQITVAKSSTQETKKLSLPQQNHDVIKTVYPALPLTPTIGYIRISHFGDNTYDEFISALDTLYNKYHNKHIVIDVRDNSGGYMEECSRILNQLFKDKNILLVYTQGRTVRKAEYKTDGRQLFDLEKIVVLINEGSASASEVFAGCIQDLDRGIVIGRPSFGKGLVQEQYMLSNGGALSLSVARFWLPSGRTLDFTGRLVESGKMFTSAKGRKIPASKSIVPDIALPVGPIPVGFKEMEAPVREAVLDYKISNRIDQPKTRLPAEVEKRILNTLRNHYNSKDVIKTNAIKKMITKSLHLANKDYNKIHQAELLEQSDVQAALRVLQ